MADAAQEPHVEVIEGRQVIVERRIAPIPPTLGLLLEGGRDREGHVWTGLYVVGRAPLRIGGARPECLREDHRLADWLSGHFIDRKGRRRSLRLFACRDCGAVQVRDVTLDVIPMAVMPTRLPLRRRDHILGWYTGARPSQRVYS